MRSSEKAREIFGDLLDRGDIELILADLQDPLCVEESVDFIIHGAAVTASKLMVSKPVETIRTAISGTENILKLALTKKVKSMVYLSSMEVYGTGWLWCGYRR